MDTLYLDLPGPDAVTATEMEMRKLHLGTISYSYDAMDEVSHQLSIAFGLSGSNGMYNVPYSWCE